MLNAADVSVAGWLGTYCYGNSCRDALVVPKEHLPDVTAKPDAQLAFSLAGGTKFAGWTASYSKGSNGPTTELGRGGDLYDSGTGDQLTSVSFVVPPPGDWALHFDLFFADGDAFYSWHLTVE